MTTTDTTAYSNRELDALDSIRAAALAHRPAPGQVLRRHRFIDAVKRNPIHAVIAFLLTLAAACLVWLTVVAAVSSAGTGPEGTVTCCPNPRPQGPPVAADW